MGSSPRVRGKLVPRPTKRGAGRLIPACAGKTSPSPANPRRTRAHPRVCGENRAHRASPFASRGSSPRVRGKRSLLRRCSCAWGLIPACAGKTIVMVIARKLNAAHPRVCGENPTRKVPYNVCRGSSPRVRGKLHRSAARARSRGLIPACAGKTTSLPTTTRATVAHPRVCGENVPRLSGATVRVGSSPRVRGKHAETRAHFPPPGLIPACAGKTVSVTLGPPLTWAHPRVCGENSGSRSDGPGLSGSSPRVRGKPGPFPTWGPKRRLIPACAGKTFLGLFVVLSRAAHPRACGENPDTTVGDLVAWGSSPRVRGKHDSAFQGWWSVGLIPARAGKTYSSHLTSSQRPAQPRACGENRAVC